MTAMIQVDNADDGVVTITFDRPQALNALTRELCEQALTALHAAAGRAARSIILTGRGRAFSAGIDLAMCAGMMDRDPEVVSREIGRDMLEVLNPLTRAVAESPIPVVCAVNGACAGGSLGIALAADVVIAARSAYFLVPQAALGIVPDLGATWALPRKVGRARALGMALLGERISAERAEAYGLIWRCVDDSALMDEARATARRLAATPAATIQTTRTLIDAAAKSTLADQLEVERLRQVEFLGSAFFRDACARFVTREKNQGSRKYDS
ncbi:enoyl-CoA hydratase-related protein [Cupriavidus necator]